MKVSALSVSSHCEGHVADEQLKESSRQLTRILAENIRAYRKSNQVSQEELADMCNLHRTYVGGVDLELTSSTRSK